jgi:hypothetical protein
LKSAIYTRLPQFPLDTYGHFCSDHEDSCLRRSYGKYWTNPSCEAQFGPASPLKVSEGMARRAVSSERSMTSSRISRLC